VGRGQVGVGGLDLLVELDDLGAALARGVTWRQLLISLPIFAALTLLINIGPFNQPLLRSIFYGVFEGAVLSVLLAVATRTERGKRGGRED